MLMVQRRQKHAGTFQMLGALGVDSKRGSYFQPQSAEKGNEKKQSSVCTDFGAAKEGNQTLVSDGNHVASTQQWLACPLAWSYHNTLSWRERCEMNEWEVEDSEEREEMDG